MSTFTVHPGVSDPVKGFRFNIAHTRVAGTSVKGISVNCYESTTKGKISLGTKTLSNTQIVTYTDTTGDAQGSVTQSIFSALTDHDFTEDSELCPIYVYFENAKENTVYEATLTFTVSTAGVETQVKGITAGRGRGEALPVMIASPVDPVFILDKPLQVTNKKVLTVLLKNANVPIKSVVFDVLPVSPDSVGVTPSSVVKQLYDPLLKRTGVIATNAGYKFEITNLDLSGSGIDLENDDVQQYTVSATVIPMNNLEISAAESVSQVYAPARINAPFIEYVAQADTAINDSTLAFKFKPPSDVLALKESGVQISRYIITDRDGNISGQDSDNSGNKISDTSGNGVRFWVDACGNFKDTSGNVLIAKKIGDIYTSELGTLDGCGNYLKNFSFPATLKGNSTISKIGITAVGTDNTTSLTSYVDISFNGDSANGMFVAPATPLITGSSVDACGNITLNVTGATRSFDVSLNVPVYPTDTSGNISQNASAYTGTTVTSTVSPLEYGYNKARKFNVKIPTTAFSGNLGDAFNMAVKILDVSGNFSTASSKFTYTKQIPADRPNFLFREVNDSNGNTKLLIAFDQSGNPLPGLGLGNLDPSANPSVELVISRKAATANAVFVTEKTQTVPTERYSVLQSGVSGELLDIPVLTAGEQVSVIGRIITKQLGGTSTFKSQDSSGVIFSAISLTGKVTDFVALKTDMSNNSLDRKLVFKFKSPVAGAPLNNYNIDVYVNDYVNPVYSGSIDASGQPFAAALPAKEHKITLTSSGAVGAPGPYNGRETLTSADASFNITGANFTWGDIVKVKVSSIGRVDANARLGAPAEAEFLMVPNAPLTFSDVSFNMDASFNDIVSYTIQHNGSTINNLTSMSVFWENLDPTASDMTVAPTPLSLFNFDKAQSITAYNRNAGDVSGNDLYYAYPKLKDSNNIIDTRHNNPEFFKGTFTRSGSAMPATSVLKVKYNTGAFKVDLNGNLKATPNQEGLKAVLSIINGENQASNSTSKVTDYKMQMA